MASLHFLGLIHGIFLHFRIAHSMDSNAIRQLIIRIVCHKDRYFTLSSSFGVYWREDRALFRAGMSSKYLPPLLAHTACRMFVLAGRGADSGVNGFAKNETG